MGPGLGLLLWSTGDRGVRIFYLFKFQYILPYSCLCFCCFSLLEHFPWLSTPRSWCYCKTLFLLFPSENETSIFSPFLSWQRIRSSNLFFSPCRPASLLERLWKIKFAIRLPWPCETECHLPERYTPLPITKTFPNCKLRKKGRPFTMRYILNTMDKSRHVIAIIVRGP